MAPISSEKGGKDFFNIPELRSKDGRLEVELSVELRKYVFEGDTVRLRTYVHPDLGDLGPCSPTVRVKAGDQLVYNIHNNLPFETHQQLNYLLILPDARREDLVQGWACTAVRIDLIRIAKANKVSNFLTKHATMSDKVWIENQRHGWKLYWKTKMMEHQLFIADTLNVPNREKVLKAYEITHHTGDHNQPHNFNTTNLHVHGWHISPYQDDIFRRVKPSYVSEYHYDLEADHPAGTFWYHPHVHGSTAIQVASGMSGALIVEDQDLTGYSDLAKASKPEHERIMIFNQIMYDPETGELPDFATLDRPDSKPPKGTSINGVIKPILEMKPGEVQRWRLIHSGFRSNLAMHFDTAFEVYQIAIDGIMFDKARQVKTIHMAPGNRTDIVIKAPAEAKNNQSLQIRSVKYIPKCEYFPNELSCQPSPPISDKNVLLTVRVAGSRILMHLPSELPGPGPGHEDILAEEICKTRTTNFNISPADKYMVNDSVFAANRIDEKPLLGTAEAWEISTKNGFGHPYHIHVNPFQVWEFGGRAVSPPIWKDVILVTGEMISFDQETKSSEHGFALVRTRYRRYWGDFVLHCHILHHEDQGMMQRIRIVRTPEESDLTEEEKACAAK
ncbi:MAG: multicopper oxidase family protein [Bacteroidota bacterium]